MLSTRASGIVKSVKFPYSFALFGINEPILFLGTDYSESDYTIPRLWWRHYRHLPMFFMHWGWIAKPIFNPGVRWGLSEGFLINDTGQSQPTPCSCSQQSLLTGQFFKVVNAETEERSKHRRNHLSKRRRGYRNWLGSWISTSNQAACCGY